MPEGQPPEESSDYIGAAPLRGQRDQPVSQPGVPARYFRNLETPMMGVASLRLVEDRARRGP